NVSATDGDLALPRLYSGQRHPGDKVLHSSFKLAERTSHVYRLFGDRRDRLEVAGPGDIVAVVGLKQTAMGHTLSDQSQPISLEEIRFPEPVISQALIPGKNVDEIKLAAAQGTIVRGDRTLRRRK